MISEKLLTEMALQAVEALRNKDYELAVTIADEIIDTDPSNAAASAVRFSSFFKSGQFERARKIGGRAAELNPNSEFILNNQACLQLEAKQPAAASGLLKSLIEKYGETPQWLYNLALAQRMVGNYEYAINTFQRTLDLDPEHDKAAYQLADCLGFVGQTKEATHGFEFVRLLRNKHAPSYSNYIHYATIGGDISAAALTQELSIWNDLFIPKNTRYSPRAIENPEQIHIGFVVDSLPANWFKKIVAPVINQLSNSIDTISLYTHDERVQTTEIDSRVKLVNAESMSDSEFANKVRADDVQVIVDVCGMRNGCRQRALGLQLVARQFAWLAHEGVFATPLLVSLERHLKQQRFFVDNSEPAEQTNFPSKTLAGIGCKNGLSDAVLSNWAYILHGLPDWKLHLDVTEKSIQKSLKFRFNNVGIKPEQLLFETNIAAKRGSIALDNFVYNDPVAVATALRSGACIVATSGDLFPAQQTAAMLVQAGLGKTISETPMKYIERAISLAKGLINPAIAEQQELDRCGLNNIEKFTKHFRNTLVAGLSK